MSNTSAKTVLITGGNTGLGKEVARQLALSGRFAKIYITSRDSEKGRAAQTSLEGLTGYSKFEVLPLELSDLRSVAALVERIEKIDAIVMNAGGTGGPTPGALTPEGVTETFASNVLGHVVLLETMLEKGLLGEVAVLAGSEAARGVPKTAVPTAEIRNQISRGIRLSHRRIILPRPQVRPHAGLRPSEVHRRPVDLRPRPETP